MKISPSRKKYPHACLTFLLLLSAFINNAFGQAEAEPWGNTTGIRKHGQLFEFDGSIKIVTGNNFNSSGKEMQRYSRNGNEQILATRIDSLFIKKIIKDESDGKILFTINLNAHANVACDMVYFCLTLPYKNSNYGTIRMSGVKDAYKHFQKAGNNYDGIASGAEFKSASGDLDINFEKPSIIRIRKDTHNGRNDLQLYIALKQNGFNKGDTLQQVFTIKAEGSAYKGDVNLILNTASHGREFEGLGGNFRLQNPKEDPQVIDYCIHNLRVAYGRVELPWRYWQPLKDIDPALVADSGKLHSEVKKAMEMARRLDSLGAPLILSAWYPPDWAIIGKPNYSPVNGVWGNSLNKKNMPAIYKSIADYILYLKNHYNVAVKLFSFNESDLGVNIRLTAQEHDDFIKGCGSYFASHGLQTKMLLGDNSNAGTYKFIYPALNDPKTRPYIGAISFHSWRGWDTEILQQWADAATKLNVPLLVGEGSIDASAYSYPDIFQEESYALNEINLYIRILAICQPLSILQWQLTADYSPLIGGGIFGNNQPLHPGQRFYNLKQLSFTPQGLFAMPISCDSPDISCSALGDNAKSIYTIHLVNNGGERKIYLKGLPANIKLLQVYNTSKNLNMREDNMVKVKDGQARFKIPATSFTTLISQ